MSDSSSQTKEEGTKNKEQVAAILLAAGRSRRMGAFKPLLPFGDTTVIESCINNLRDAGVGDFVIVIGHRADEIRNHLKSAAVTFALNPNPDSEMNQSIACGVREVAGRAGAILIALVDYPAVTAETNKILIDAGRRGAVIVQPEYATRGGHPVLIDMNFRDELLHLDSRKGLRGFFDAHRREVLRLAVESPFVARDMDTWEHYLALHQEVFGRPPRQI